MREFEKQGFTKRQYQDFHYTVKETYGEPVYCEICGRNPFENRGAKRYEWALLKGHLYDDIKNGYFSLCTSCHRTYDMTDETRRNMSQPRTTKHKQNISKAQSGRKMKPHKKVKCPYCGKIGGASGMKHWHFENCNIKQTNG